MPELHSRRRFLRRSAAIAAGACTSLALAGDVNGGAASRLKVGIVGTDKNSLALADVIRESGAEVVAHCDAAEPHRPELHATHSKAVKFNDAWSMIDHASLDAVVISRDVSGAADIARCALQRGRHVYASPLGESIAEVRELGELASRSGLLTQADLRSASEELIQHVVNPLRSGAIGRIREVVCWSSSSGARGFQFQGQRVLSVPMHALGLQHPAAINSAGTTPPGSTFPEGIAVRYAFPRRDETTPLYVTWYDGAWAPPYESIDGLELSGCGALYLGETGQLLDDLGTDRAMLLREGLPPQVLGATAAAPHQSLRNWLNACAGRPHPLTGLDAAATLNQTILAGLIAYRVQQPLDWDGPAMRARNCPQVAELIRSNADDISLA